MADWLNHAVVAAPRNGTTSHTAGADGTGGTVVAGTGFSPTSGRFLLCFVYGGVTSTTPTGWTLPASGSAVNNGGLYCFYRASATATSADQITSTANGSNYPLVFDFYEFGAGSTFGTSASSFGVALAGGAGPTLSGLTGTNWTAGIAGNVSTNTTTTGSVTWNAGTELTDTSIVMATTEGYIFSVTATDANTATSASYAATFTNGTSTNLVERLVVAVKAASAPASIPDIVMAPRR